VLFAPRKPTIHHTDHDRLDAILRALVDRAVRPHGSGRRPRRHRGARLRARHPRDERARRLRDPQSRRGHPRGRRGRGRRALDGEAEAAIFPGELPSSAESVFQGARAAGVAALPALPARRSSAPMRPDGPRSCRRSASTGRSSSCSETSWHDDPRPAASDRP
jgi:hypothetical protein